MFIGFLQLFIGIAMARFSEPTIGILVGTIIQSLINMGFAQMSLSLSAQNIINAFILLGFLVFTMNQYKFKEAAVIRQMRRQFRRE
jgi:ribose/xylose/arabinose/galactoside ABC-type transport system permease subunit